MSKPIAWSYSRLNNFETCPKKFYHLSVSKDVKEAESENMRYGKAAHKAIELRIGKGKKLPLQFQHLEPIIAKFADASGTIMVEQQLALNQKFQPTGWFDNDVWVRAVIDYAVVSGSTALVVDWKTGKISDDFTQQKLAAAIFMIFHPEVKTINCMFYWLKDKKPTVQALNRSDMKHVWAPMLRRVMAYTQAHEQSNFPPRPSGLCKKYCPVTACPHHGIGGHG